MRDQRAWRRQRGQRTRCLLVFRGYSYDGVTRCTEEKHRRSRGARWIPTSYSFKRCPGLSDGDPEIAVATHCGGHAAVTAILMQGVRHLDQLGRTMHTSVNMSMLCVAAKFPGRLDLPLLCLALRLHAGALQ